MSSVIPLRSRIRISHLAVVAAWWLFAVPAHAATLVTIEDVVLCTRLIDLGELQSRLKAGDKAGAALYLEGEHPPCLVLKTGDTVEQMDRTDGLLQVVTRHGTPRFIGWGNLSSFAEKP